MEISKITITITRINMHSGSLYEASSTRIQEVELLTTADDVSLQMELALSLWAATTWYQCGCQQKPRNATSNEARINTKYVFTAKNALSITTTIPIIY